MNDGKEYSVYLVFEGKMVVSGGFNISDELKSVELYNYHENKWTYLPDIIYSRVRHGSVSMCKKMFVIGGQINSSKFEWFDSITRKFIMVKQSILLNNIKATCVFSIGYKILAFSDIRDYVI